MNLPELERLRVAVIESPRLYPLQFDELGDLVQCVALSESDYTAASFLDERLLRRDSRTGVIPWVVLRSMAEALPLQCDFLFHLSHCGSTLMSRLLGLHPRIFSLREPAILRCLGAAKLTDRLDPLLRLWSRTFRPGQRTIIKATSIVNAIATKLMTTASDARGLLMFVPLTTFLPALLEGALSDIETHAQDRLLRLQAYGIACGVASHHLSPGEKVAMSWLCEMHTLRTLASRFPNRTLWVDFDQFLAQSESEWQRVLDFLGTPANPSHFATHPLMQRYAKKTEVPYDATTREKLLMLGRARFQAEIERGLAWHEHHAPALAMA